MTLLRGESKQKNHEKVVGDPNLVAIEITKRKQKSRSYDGAGSLTAIVYACNFIACIFALSSGIAVASLSRSRS